MPPSKKTLVKSNKKINFETYIYRVLKQVHPDFKISKESKEFVNDIILRFLNDFVPLSITMVEHNRQKTLSSRDIQSAVRVLFVGQLAKHAVSEGTKAVVKFTSTPINKKKKITTAKKAGLQFPPSRVRSIIEKIIPDYKTDARISSVAPVYLTAVIEYLTAELLELSGNVARDANRSILRSEDIKKAIENDDELQRTLCRLSS